jgi:hypothetical protein
MTLRLTRTNITIRDHVELRNDRMEIWRYEESSCVGLNCVMKLWAFFSLHTMLIRLVVSWS